ncbi:MAG: phosphoglycerate kinase [Actinomycetota bacterium]|jgi:phosphoglycerate kinase|nr:phosphoglycerate kinase [Actinomycetota bacterium]
MDLPVLEDLRPVAGKRVLVRCDFNVPISNGVITDDLRIRLPIETLTWLLDEGAAKLTVCSHLGRPKGKPDPKYSIAPVRKHLEGLLRARGAHISQVELLENLRYNAGEEANDPDFVKSLVENQDLYVDDAFGAAHRAHASIVGPPKFLPSAAGRVLAREVEVLDGLLQKPERPFVAVLGGAKVSDKLGVIDALLEKVDTLLVGGGMCFTFLAAEGHNPGGSLLEHEFVENCKRLLASARASGKRIVLPTDIVALSPDGVFGTGKEPAGEWREMGQDLPDGWLGLDIGPGTAAAFADEISTAATVFWNGPMGVFEDPRFAAGTRTVAEAVASTKAFTVVGGGDSASALESFGLAGKVDHLSTGGGASLEFIEKGDLPGLVALREAASRRDS